jgi:hypothetical protein
VTEYSTPRIIDRPARSRRELSELPPADSRARVQYLRERGQTLSPETLVHVAREACTAGDRSVVQECGRLLYGVPLGNGRFTEGHCEPMITSHARHFGFGNTEQDRIEFRARCHAALWHAIMAGSDQKPFFEERFYPALKGLVIDVGRSMAAERDRHGLDNPALDESSDYEGVAPVDGESDPINGIVTNEIKDALRRLPVPERDAAWLAWIQDWQIESKDPHEQRTVAVALKITGRMVRKRLTAAVQHLREDPIIARIRDDHGWS